MRDIESERLILRLLSTEALAATVAGDRLYLEALLGLSVPEDWFEEAWVAELRLEQLRSDPSYHPWSIRAISLKATGEVVGAINCHAKPAPLVAAGSHTIATELGYTVFAPWRRLGIATESIRALTAWGSTQGLQSIIMAISPANVASLALARKLGAVRIGSQIDEKHGVEDVYFARI
jgi:RimJ/RimL family protein N-acetyltransferase